MPATVLAVCTGNVCRSPALERMLRRDLDDVVRVVSAGTQARATSPVDPPMAELMEADGLVTKGFAAQQLTARVIERADLVVTATREHRSAVVRLVPAAVRRTFTLLELARLVGTLDAAALPRDTVMRVAGLPAAANAERSRHLGRHDDDLPDPFGRRPRVYRKAYEQIRDAEAALAAVLATAPAHRKGA
ncbi:low molecular weight phosphatase family protein [Cellulomonas sp. PhB143]|uniref:arsenate reductase/protein-tyrosine-phosphatase family protein n=1 Tax=Cellulomonas sp. PhB143 TaxID=2485186 RepID=UPI000FACDCBA|nr:low molecular weight phosphatase family protein [Cellulomonas sp. PhB143]ROS78670.1 protein-tyrosine phosphatase [Cellulomonas sp. PhB143]